MLIKKFGINRIKLYIVAYLRISVFDFRPRLNLIFYIRNNKTSMDPYYHTVLLLVRNGHKVKIATININDSERKLLNQTLEDDIGEEKISYIYHGNNLVLNSNTGGNSLNFKHYDQNIQILDLVDFSKKSIRAFFGRSAVNIIMDYKDSELRHPMYIGLFPDLKNVTEILDDEKLTDKHTQDTPLHVTLEYLGGKNKTETEYPYGKTVEIEVFGYSENKAGTCLLVKIKDLHIEDHSTSPKHITLGTNKEFKPADVGKEITDSNSKCFENSYKVKSVLAVMF